jgi:hypothetical protein
VHTTTATIRFVLVYRCRFLAGNDRASYSTTSRAKRPGHDADLGLAASETVAASENWTDLLDGASVVFVRPDFCAPQVPDHSTGDSVARRVGSFG